MDINLVHPFPEINVVVDCGGFRVDAPKVNIAIKNGEIDAKKSAVSITGTYHLHPFQAVLEGVKKVEDSDEDNMTWGIIGPIFLAAAKVSNASGQEADGTKFEEFAADRTFCLEVGKQLMKDVDDGK